MKNMSLDPFLMALLFTIALAAIIPASGNSAIYIVQASYIAVSLLFCLYGAKLEAQVIWSGLANWKLQGLVLAMTFLLIPAFGFILFWGFSSLLPQELLIGLLFLTILPSTVQSSIAITAMARGNIPAAICATSISNVLGVFVTPAFAALLLSAKGFTFDAHSIFWICMQLLLPFLVGQLLRPFLGRWIEDHRQLTSIVDRGSILLIVYSAFSAGMISGVWRRLDGVTFVILATVVVGLLFAILFVSKEISRSCNLSREDEITLLFCGSQKSLATGIPMASIVFAGHASSLIIVPLMLYHQLQLFVCSTIAQRYARTYTDR